MVYVVDVGQLSLAFEAGTDTEAADMVAAPWFVRAVNGFCVDMPGLERVDPHPRVATSREAVLFHDMADEFAEVAPAFLLARVG